MPFHIIRSEITKVTADAIVNAENPDLVFSRGAEGAIYRAAGDGGLLAAREKIGRIPLGGAAFTPAFGLGAKYIIHTAGPVWQGGGQGEADTLRLCYRNCLRLARKQGCGSIAFPLISPGEPGFPKEEALRIALWEIGSFLAREDMLVWLVASGNESLGLPGKLFADIASYIDGHYAAAASLLPKALGTGRGKGGAILPAAQQAAAAGAANMLREETAYAKRRGLFQRKAPGTKERSLEDVVAQLGETFQQRLFRLIDERGLTDVEVYKKANLDRKLFSKIRCNSDYRPKKITAVALAVALELNLDDTKDLLSRAEIALSPSSKFDLIISYFIERESYDVYTINVALFQYGQPLLGA